MREVKIVDTKLRYDYKALMHRSCTDMIVLHHTGNPTNDDCSAREINRSHQAQSWACIGYHYVIRKDGSIELGRPHWTIGAHAYGDNDHTLGIHMCGNFVCAPPTEAQIEAVSLLVAKLCKDYGLPVDSDHVVGHCDLMATACPGRQFYEQMQTIRGKAIWYQKH